MKNFISRLVDLNQREVNRLEKRVGEINALEKRTKKLKDKSFAQKTNEFRKRLKKGESLEDLLPEAFALVREATWRTLGMRHYDVQMAAATALFEGTIAEQKTGEGKTLSATPALYLRALRGKGAHLVTVNDYLARRDAGWNSPTFRLLGISVGAIGQEQGSYVYDPEYSDTGHGDKRLENLKPTTRAEAYKADITYGTNNEFGFDYLRDNMVSSLDQMVQRGHYFAIVDEVDQVLIDEARTPLIISAPDTEPTEKYYTFAQMAERLSPDVDYTIDEKQKAASLTEHGISKLEKELKVDNLYEKNFDTIHHIENALRARALYLRDREYVVKDNQVIIVDEFTGRLMPGRRWSDGLHQAVEAKERVVIQQESKTLATISFQNYFRMYKHLSGMTGTAATESDEFRKIYNLDVVVIPTNRPTVRKDNGDVIYKTAKAKYSALLSEIESAQKKGQPVLIGTTSIEKNEIIGSLLKRKKIAHEMLNAKNHEREAMIIADAGKPRAVTVATNMAGRGVDIVLGGAPPDRQEDVSIEKYKTSKEYKAWEAEHRKVLKAGGLFVIGTERHESRRIDNQLRGRSGRQGDPGASRFYLSLDDDLMRIFGGEQISGLMEKLKLPEDQPIENTVVSRAIQQAQVKVEGFHFDARKRLVEYDDVANQQREIVYELRKHVLKSKDLKDEVLERVTAQVLKLAPDIEYAADKERLAIELSEIIPFDEGSRQEIKNQLEKTKSLEDIHGMLEKIVVSAHASREKQLGEPLMRMAEKHAYLSAIDHLWIDHIDHIDGLREGVVLRAYGQRNPLVEFKNEAFNLFEALLSHIDEELAKRLFRIQVATQPRSEIPLDEAHTNVDTADSTGLAGGADVAARVAPPAFGDNLKTPGDALPRGKKIGRNDPCPCGSGKKYKKCGLIGAPEHRG